MSIKLGTTDINNAYTGSAQVTRMYLGADLVYSYTHAVSYLECTGTQYIDTGISLDAVDSFEVEVDFAPTRFFDDNDIFSTGVSTDNSVFINSGGELVVRYNAVESTHIQLTLDTRIVLNVAYNNPTCTVSINGTQRATFDTTPTAVTSALWLFSRVDYAELDVWAFNIVINGMASMNCTPYEKGGVGCFYDYVGGNFISSDGADDFVVGT